MNVKRSLGVTTPPDKWMERVFDKSITDRLRIDGVDRKAWNELGAHHQVLGDELCYGAGRRSLDRE